MLNPQMPNMPGVGAVTDTLDFVKNLWGGMNVPGMNIPGMSVPSLSVDDLDKKIADLKAVDAWLNVNTTMLRTTIQALEVQRGTIATLKAMGASLAQAVSQPGAENKAAPFPGFFAPPAEQPAAPTTPQAAAGSEATTQSDAAAGLSAATAWWNLLQDQFKQAVTSAMSPEAMAGAAALAQDAAAKFSAASSRAVADLGKGMGDASPKADPGDRPEPAASGSAKPRAAKPKAGKG